MNKITHDTRLSEVMQTRYANPYRRAGILTVGDLIEAVKERGWHHKKGLNVQYIGEKGRNTAKAVMEAAGFDWKSYEMYKYADTIHWMHGSPPEHKIRRTEKRIGDRIDELADLLKYYKSLQAGAEEGK
jgi:hypothetical protein